MIRYGHLGHWLIKIGEIKQSDAVCSFSADSGAVTSVFLLAVASFSRLIQTSSTVPISSLHLIWSSFSPVKTICQSFTTQCPNTILFISRSIEIYRQVKIKMIRVLQVGGFAGMDSSGDSANTAAIDGINSRLTDKEPAPEGIRSHPPPPQHVWTQGFEKLLEDPLGLRAFAVSAAIPPIHWSMNEFQRRVFSISRDSSRRSSATRTSTSGRRANAFTACSPPTTRRRPVLRRRRYSNVIWARPRRSPSTSTRKPCKRRSTISANRDPSYSIR